MAKRSLFDQLDLAISAVIADEKQQAAPEIASLARIAAELRPLPREGFMQELETKLKRSTSMATMPKPRVETRTAAVPRIAFKDVAKAIAFYEEAFGAKEIMRFEVGGNIPHAEIEIGDSTIMVAGEWPEGNRFSAETLGNSPVAMQLSVPDVDAFVERAVAAGATIELPITNQFYGRREGTLRDPFGYRWGISTLIEELPVDEMYRRFAAMEAGKPKPAVDPVPRGYRMLTPYVVAENAAGLIDFVKTAFAAEEAFRTSGGAGGIHCEVRVGDSMLMIGGGGPGLAWSGTVRPGAFHIYVRDCDATYAKALEAGAVSVDKPTDQPYGERSATVKDAAGNNWYIATRSEGNYKWEGAPDVQVCLHPLRAEPVIQFLRRAFGAQEVSRHATPQGVIKHVTMKMGDSYMELGEAHGPYQPMQSMFYLYVPDVDRVYAQALAAGATSISEVKDQPYGDRSGGVQDVFGNQWYIATHVKDM